MQLADVVEAILAADIRGVRQAFREFVSNQGAVVSSSVPWQLLLAEVCRELLDDVHTMPQDMCTKLDMAAGSTYARGADRMMSQASQLHHAQPEHERGA